MMNSSVATMVANTELADGWLLKAVGGSGLAAVPAHIARAAVPATVPGCVHTDLFAAGLIPDPYLDDNESALSWIGRVDWRYETRFDWADPGADTVVELVCAGLDTIARIELNGKLIARTQNMHRGYRFDVWSALRAGTNELAVTFASALDHAEAMRDHFGSLPHVNRFPFNMIRKMAANFGWDWGPELVTAGIWRPIAVRQWRTARLAAVRPLVGVHGDTGRVDVHVNVARAPGHDGPLAVSARIGAQQATTAIDAAASEAVLRIDVPRVALWWPRGYGEQPRYPLAVELSTADGAPVDRWAGAVGFRTVELDTGPDEHGSRFTFVVNGVPIFAKGVNWIPDDCFPHRVDRKRYARRLAQAEEAGVNLVRVWGGGIYESEDFYDLADERGLLVWQDFLFACAAYPEEEPLRSEVIAEAREAVTRLARHPSLALWNGCNENIWGYHDWDWRDQIGERTWGLGYYTDILPKIVGELDPTRPYCPGSPWSFSSEIHPNDANHGCMHIWDVWNRRDYPAYRDHIPRFAAEFGFCGPPTMPTLLRAIHDDPLSADSAGIVAHNKADDGVAKLARGLAAHFRPPRDFPDWHWAAQLNQARAVSFGVQHFRSYLPRVAGMAVWQLNDCWPVVSWAMVDGDGRRKPAWYALRASYADRLLTIQPRAGGLALIAINDTAQPWTGLLDVRRIDFAGAVLATAELAVDVPARGAVTHSLPTALCAASRPQAELLVASDRASASTDRAVWFFAGDLDQELPAPEFIARAEAISGGYRVSVVAATLLRELTLLADQVAGDAVVDQALVTLLPGESTIFTVHTVATLDPPDLTTDAVLRTANQLQRWPSS